MILILRSNGSERIRSSHCMAVNFIAQGSGLLRILVRAGVMMMLVWMQVRSFHWRLPELPDGLA
jgi:hypothetical protein